jgi:hypothetical protein
MADSYERFAEIYHFLLTGISMVKVLGCAYYDAHINEELVTEIQEIQGDLPLTSEDIQLAIDLLRLSPSALAYALQPDPVVVNYRRQTTVLSTELQTKLDEVVKSRFFSYFYYALIIDYKTPILNPYFHDIRGLQEVETYRRIVGKGDQELLFEFELKDRLGRGQTAEEFGGQYITVLLPNDAPEPWERSSAGTQPAEAVNG